MYTIIGAAQTRAMRVLWMLEELDQPYEHIEAAPRSEDVIRHNPDGKIPVLLVDGEALTDSVAIIQFLADRHDALTFPSGSVERAHQDSITQFCVDEVEGALWTAAKNTFVLPENKRVPEIKETCRFEFSKAMDRLERRLGDNTYVTGDTFTVPDILLGHCARWAQSAKFELPAGKVGAYFDRVQARPALKRAVEKYVT